MLSAKFIVKMFAKNMKTRKLIITTGIKNTNFVIIAFFYSGLYSKPNNAQARAIDIYATSESVDSLSNSMNDLNIY